MNIHSYYKPKTFSCGTEKIISGHIPPFESKYNKLYSVEKVKPVKQYTLMPIARVSHTSSSTSWPYPNHYWEDPRNFFTPFKSSTLTTSGNIRQVTIK